MKPVALAWPLFNWPHFASVVLAACWFTCTPARAAQDYDGCTNVITALPATIGTQGTWCLQQDLATSITTGNAITVNTNNVTIDCNGYKLGGLGAGAGTETMGISAVNRRNLTIRNCHVRGFYIGAYLYGATGGGHVLENNHFEANLLTGIDVAGSGSLVRSNRVTDTGGSTLVNGAYGIHTQYSVDVVDNMVGGVVARAGGNGNATGILTSTSGNGSVVGNRISGLAKDGTGKTYGIYNTAAGRLVLKSNSVFGDGSTASIGLRCDVATGRARGNIVRDFATGISVCGDALGNDVSP